jgi:hypothetical protein
MSWPRLEPGRFISLRSRKEQDLTVRLYVILSREKYQQPASTIDTGTGTVSETRQGVHE